MIYYLYNDEDLQLIGIDKTTCSALKMDFLDGEINEWKKIRVFWKKRYGWYVGM